MVISLNEFFSKLFTYVEWIYCGISPFDSFWRDLVQINDELDNSQTLAQSIMIFVSPKSLHALEDLILRVLGRLREKRGKMVNRWKFHF